MEDKDIQAIVEETKKEMEREIELLTPPPLTFKQERFCQNYVRNNGNGADAARRAGYSEFTAKEMSHENLTKPHIRARIKQIELEHADAAGVTKEWVMHMLKTNATMCQTGMGLPKDQPNPGGSNSALSEINKMIGGYAAEKTLNTNIEVKASEEDGEDLLEKLIKKEEKDY